MAINNAIIRIRRGPKDELQIDKLLPGELAMATDAPIMWFCWAPGNVEQIPTSENVTEIIEEITREYLSGYAKKTEIPTKTSQLENDSNFLTEHQDLSEYAKKATTLSGYGITDGATKEQFNQLSDEIDDCEESISVDFLQTTTFEQGYISNSPYDNGGIIESTDNITCGFIELPMNTIIHVIIPTGAKYLYAVYDSNKKYISRSDWINESGIIKVQSNELYRITFNFGDGRNMTKEEALKFSVKYVVNIYERIADFTIDLLSHTTFEQGYLNNSTAGDGGTVINSPDNISSGFVKAPNGKKITVNVPTSGRFLYALYDGDKKYITRTGWITQPTTLEIADDQFLRFSFSYTDGRNMNVSELTGFSVTYIATIREVVENNLGYLPKPSRYLYIAASNSDVNDKMIADYVCSGTNDEIIINQAIASLKYGGTIHLFDGDYYLDSFENEGNTAIYFGHSGFARTITLKGTTENKAYLSRYGVTIHVRDSAMTQMNAEDTYRAIGCYQGTVDIGDWWAHPNNVNFENFYLYLSDCSKKIIGIDGQHFGSMDMKQVGIYHKDYFYNRFNHIKPPSPVDGSIGVISVSASNDEMARIGMDCVNVGGVHTGILLSGVDHLIMKTCTTARCIYGYKFKGLLSKTLTMINCCDEGNRHLPFFSGEGQITCIDLNVERLNDAHIPDDPSGSTELYAEELNKGGWHGFISYTLQGDNMGMHKFWKDGNGKQIKTINLKHESSGTRPTNYPSFKETFFDVVTNKTVTWNGENWVDAMGNVVNYN